jgi:polyhydroxyalkanoate synthesis regulator phasin
MTKLLNERNKIAYDRANADHKIRDPQLKEAANDEQSGYASPAFNVVSRAEHEALKERVTLLEQALVKIQAKGVNNDHLIRRV